MSESQKGARISPIETDLPGLRLVQMLTPEDDEAYFKLQNANIDYWQEFGNKIDETVEEVTAGRLEHGNGQFGIWLNDELIGMVEYSLKRYPDQAEIGVLLDKKATHHGYATEAIKSLTEYAKQRFNRVYAEVAPDNERSIKLLTRAGYQGTGEKVSREWGEALVFEAPK